MVIDSSAFLAILRDEPERGSFRDAIEAAPRRIASAVTVFETSMVMLARFGELGLAEFRDLLRLVQAEVAGFGPDEIEGAVEAFRRFGRSRHRAGLNFGDCFSYALARATGEPLLFKGEDFARTDVARVL
ncbi:MAG TPA: type II toxin-antitoxin system VapC family toxin [Caulobacteraceae bacterium]|nr:type II toxin-antitoxin system VapC family toxin [Caulobacteraceae bacterium]